MKIKTLIFFIKHVSFIKTLRFNFKYLSLNDAILLPVFISKKTRYSNLGGTVIIQANKKTMGMIQIGFGNVPVFDRRYSRTVWNNTGNIVFKGKTCIGHGSKIGCGGNLIFGNNTSITAESMIVCDNEITFGDDVLLSWGIQIMDTDFHKVIINNKLQNPNAKVEIGNHTWIGSRVTINKGVILPDNTIVAAGSVVTKSFVEQNTLIGGVPAKILRSGVKWEI